MAAWREKRTTEGTVQGYSISVPPPPDLAALIAGLAVELGQTTEELRELRMAGEPVSRARYFERQAILFRQCARLADRLSELWAREEGR